MKKIGEYSEWLERVLVYAGCFFLAQGTLITFVEVVSRYIFSVSHPWAEEAMRFSMLYGILLFLGPCTRGDGHIIIDFVVDRLNEETLVRKVMQIIVNVLCFLFAAFLVWVGMLLLFKFYQLGSASLSMEMPLWIVYISFVLGAFFMACYFLEALFKSFIVVINRKEKIRKVIESV